MKIADWKNYELPTESVKNKVEIFKKREKIPLMKKINQSFIDFTLANFIRIIIGILVFKLFMANVQNDVMVTLKEYYITHEEKKFMSVIVQNRIHWYLVYSALASFFIGSLYYILMQRYSSFGTIGMKVTKLQILNKKLQRPSLGAIAFYYILKFIYPMMLMLAIVFYYFRGVSAPFLVCALIGILFSDAFSMVLGIQPLYEKFSGVKISLKK